MQVELIVNGSSYTAPVEPQRTLADFLRDDLRLTGTHLGCEHGVCGACTVIVDGQAVRSCLMFAVQADGSEVMTIEGPREGREAAPSPRSVSRLSQLPVRVLHARVRHDRAGLD